MSEISTRVWLDERVWAELTNRAVTEGITVRELIPRLVGQSLTVTPSPTGGAAEQADSYAPPFTPADALSSPESPPSIALSDVYRCGICGAEIRLGGLSQHMNKHKKEREASEAERS